MVVFHHAVAGPARQRDIEDALRVVRGVYAQDVDLEFVVSSWETPMLTTSLARAPRGWLRAEAEADWPALLAQKYDGHSYEPIIEQYRAGPHRGARAPVIVVDGMVADGINRLRFAHALNGRWPAARFRAVRREG